MVRFQRVTEPQSGGTEYDAFVTMYRREASGQVEAVPIRVARVFVHGGWVEAAFFERGFSLTHESGKRSLIYSTPYPKEPTRNAFISEEDRNRHLELISGALLVRLKSDKTFPTFIVEE